MTTATLLAPPPAVEGARVGTVHAGSVHAGSVQPAAAGPLVVGAGVACSSAQPQGSSDATPVLVPSTHAVSPDTVATLSDDALLSLHRSIAEHRRLLDASFAIVSAEIDHRSRRELGANGLAQSRGLRTGEALVQQSAGVTAVDARTLVRVGSLVASQTRPDPGAPWLRSVADEAAGGRLSLAAAEAIRAGLGAPSDSVTAAQLAAAATVLLAEASQITIEQLAVRARQRRDSLDEEGVADREQQRHDRRFLSLTHLPDGMTRLSGLLDPESAAIVVGAIDAATSPRRGGPRFVDESAPAPEVVLEDTRTIPQLMADALVDIVRVATLADDGTVLGARRVGVRVHVAELDLRRGAGAAHLEGQTAGVSIATAERHACESGLTPIVFRLPGQPLDVGHTQRHFTPRQRVALAARDGGCRGPGCDRPPAWTEAHHIDEWLRDDGPTDLDNGTRF